MWDKKAPETPGNVQGWSPPRGYVRAFWQASAIYAAELFLLGLATALVAAPSALWPLALVFVAAMVLVWMGMSNGQRMALDVAAGKQVRVLRDAHASLKPALSFRVFNAPTGAMGVLEYRGVTPEVAFQAAKAYAVERPFLRPTSERRHLRLAGGLAVLSVPVLMASLAFLGSFWSLALIAGGLALLFPMATVGIGAIWLVHARAVDAWYAKWPGAAPKATKTNPR